MFTGIIEEIGCVVNIENLEGAKRISIKAETIMSDIKLGDSIAIDGVCLTVSDINFSKDIFCVEIVKETLNKSSLANIKKDGLINLERSVRLSDRLSGHIVQGHIEGVAIIINKKIDNNDVILDIELEPHLMKFCITKGSITIDGVSLTIADINENIISIALIPHTISNTVLGLKQKNDLVNIEIDILSKYVKKFINDKK